MYVVENPNAEEWTRIALTTRYLGSMDPCEVPANLLAREGIIAVIYGGRAYLYENYGGRTAAFYVALTRGREVHDKRELGCREYGPRTS